MSNSLARIPLTIVQIDQDKCCLEWKQTNTCGTCNAGAENTSPCFNTFATCQSQLDYALGEPLTLSFTEPQSNINDEAYIIPSVKSISTSPGRINVGGRSGRDQPLGRRNQIKITFTDHPHSDNFVDPYLDQRNYDAFTRGTFWSKWLKRNPYYAGRAIRIYEGFDNQSLAEMKIRHYIIDKIDGVDSRGNVTVTALDILAVASDKKAQAPYLTSGFLLNDLNETDTSVIVTGATLEEYTNLPGQAIRIGKEVMRYSSVTLNIDNDLVFSGLVRGSDGTDIEAHESEDTVQGCLEYVAVRADNVAKDLLVTYGNVDANYIDDDEWEQEGLKWLDQFVVTRLITEPMGVTTLLGELSEQCMFFIWWDDYSQKIRMKAVAPDLDIVPLIDEHNNIIQNSVNVSTKPEMRANEIWIDYKLKTPVDKTGERENYRRTSARLDPAMSTDFAFGERIVYEIFSPWLQSELQVDLATFRLLERYKKTPTYIQFELDALDSSNLMLGDAFDIRYSGFVDNTGQMELIRYQIISRHYVNGSVIKFEAQKFDFEAGAKFGRWSVSDAPVYADATDEEKQSMAFWSNPEGLVGEDETGYTWV